MWVYIPPTSLTLLVWNQLTFNLECISAHREVNFSEGLSGRFPPALSEIFFDIMNAIRKRIIH